MGTCLCLYDEISVDNLFFCNIIATSFYEDPRVKPRKRLNSVIIIRLTGLAVSLLLSLLVLKDKSPGLIM
jgi:hypothetical protein